MAICGKCGEILSDGVRFCSGCGEKVLAVVARKEIFCSDCGKRLEEGARFCSACGTVVSKSETSVTVVQTKTLQEEKRKTLYEGEIHKCPNCGELVDSFKPRCSSCGYEIRGAKTASSVQELAEKLQAVEEERGKWGSILKQKVQNFGIPIILPRGNRGKSSWIDQKKAGIIKSFPIPNTKEDLLEFIIMASSNLYSFKDEVGNEGLELYDAWDMKLEQAIQKVIMSFSSDDIFLRDLRNIMQNRYAKILKKKMKQYEWKKLFF